MAELDIKTLNDNVVLVLHGELQLRIETTLEVGEMSKRPKPVQTFLDESTGKLYAVELDKTYPYTIDGKEIFVVNRRHLMAEVEHDWEYVFNEDFELQRELECKICRRQKEY